MGFYLRKSIKVGPIRFNLSKSGVGVSAGVTGFRIGTGPRGNYVHMGRGGIYYRKTVPSGNGRGDPTPFQSGGPSPQLYEPQTSTVGPMVDIDSADIAKMSDSSSTELLQELRDKRKKIIVEPIVIICAAIAFAGALAADVDPIILVSLAAISGVAAYLARRRDIFAKTVVLFYDFDTSLEKAYAALHESASKVAASAGCWHIAASGRVYDSKYHAGASSLVDRKRTFITHTAPPFLKTNIDTVSIGVGRQTIYLFPDRALVYEAGEVGAIGYDQLRVSVTQTRFIEDSAPADARVIDRTWRYVNKRGGPDRRFSNNRELPICLYDELHFASPTGLNEIIQVSKCDVGQLFEAALDGLRADIISSRLRPSSESQGSASATDDIEEPGRKRYLVAVACIAVLGAAVTAGVASRIRQSQPETAPESQALEAITPTRAAAVSPAVQTTAPSNFPAVGTSPSSASPLPATAAGSASAPRATPTPPARALPHVPLQPSPQPSATWVTTTTRVVRVKGRAQEIVIPKGAQLRVVGRSASDVLVSYKGSTVTIPASATDLK